MMQRATILLAHGSRDPLWSRPTEAVAQRMRELDPSRLVRCAYLELMQPDLLATVAQLACEGADAVTIVPMFLGVGQHARRDLPLLMSTLAHDHPQISFTLQMAIGENPRVLELMAKVALE